MGVDRGGKSDVRQRRALQKLADDPFGSLGVVVGSGISWDSATATLQLDIATNSGLEFAGVSPADKLAVNVDENFGLSLNSSGIRVDIVANSGLEFITGDLAVNVDENFGLSLNSSGIRIDLAASSGLEFSSGDLRIDLNSTALTLTASGLTTPNFSVAAGALTISATDAINVNATTNFNAAAGGNVTFFTVNGNVNFTSLGGAVNVQGDLDVLVYSTSGNLLLQSDNAGLTVAVAGDVAFQNAGLGFYSATPIAQPGGYTITAAPAVSTALNADANGGAYTTAPLSLLTAATLADLNDLRADVASLSSVLRQLIKHLGNNSGLGLVSETGF